MIVELSSRPLSAAFLIAITTMTIAFNAKAVADDSDGSPQYVVHPRIVESPNRLYSISIEPSHLNGEGSGKYTCTSQGNVLWSKKLPFTLWSAEVTNQGTLIGHAYTQGIEGRFRDDGAVVIAAVNAEGKILVNESTPRVPSRFLHSSPTPMVNAIQIDVDNDRFLVRWDDPDLNRRIEKWDFYSISSGEKKGSFEPKLSLNNQDSSPWLLQAHFISGTKLTLAQFKTYSHPNYDLVYAIFGDTEDSLWLLRRQGEFDAASEASVRALHDRVNSEGTILDNKAVKQFDLQFIKEAQRVTFEVETWDDRKVQVKEVQRQPQTYETRLPTDKEDSGVAMAADLSSYKELKYVGAIELKPAKVSKPHLVRDISEGFDFDDAGNIGFVRASKETDATFVLVTQDGLVLAELKLAKDLLPESDWNGAIYVGENRFLVTTSQSGVGAQSQAWVVDTNAKLVSRLENFRSPPVESVASFRDGGFVVLANERFEYTMANSLTRYNSLGNRMWTVSERYETYPNTLFSPQAIAATTDGTLCVLEGSKKELQYFDKDGKFLRVVDIAKAWGHAPNYLSEISAANDSGLLIFDFGGTPPVIEMNGAGIVRNRMDARIAKDRPVLHPNGPPRVSPTGQVWLSDGTTLFRVGPDGLVDHSLGAELDNGVLGEVDFNMVTRSGAVFAISRLTGAVHRFDAEGKSIGMISDPALLDRKYASQPLFVLPQGDIYVLLPETTDSQRIVHFTSAGEKVRTINLNGYAAYCLGEGSFLCTSLTFGVLQSNNGKLLKKIRRQPDGNWLQNIGGVAVAPDGSFAISAFHGDSNTPLPASINIYSPKGEPIRTVVVPVGRLGQFDFDGSRLAVSSDERTLVYSAEGTLLSWASHRDFTGKSLFIHPKLLKEGTELVLIDHNHPSEIRRYR